jgi:hypothetical protein
MSAFSIQRSQVGSPSFLYGSDIQELSETVKQHWLQCKLYWSDTTPFALKFYKEEDALDFIDLLEERGVERERLSVIPVSR